jgi:hypothetical protein
VELPAVELDDEAVLGEHDVGGVAVGEPGVLDDPWAALLGEPRRDVEDGSGEGGGPDAELGRDVAAMDGGGAVGTDALRPAVLEDDDLERGVPVLVDAPEAQRGAVGQSRARTTGEHGR